MSNPYVLLKQLLPDSPVLVGLVTAHFSDDTSTVLLPTNQGNTPLGDNVNSGSVIRVRGTTVPVGKKAFIRDGVIETQAPDTDPIQITIGKTLTPFSKLIFAGPLPVAATVVDTAYSLNLSSYWTGGMSPRVYALVGALPTGLILNATTGILAGTSTAAFTGALRTVQVTDSVGQSSNAELTVGALKFTGTVANQSTPPSTAYSINLGTYWTGGIAPVMYSSATGTLPSGFSFNTTTGVLSGSSGSALTASGLSFSATDAGGATVTTNTFSLTVAAPGVGLVVMNAIAMIRSSDSGSSWTNSALPASTYYDPASYKRVNFSIEFLAGFPPYSKAYTRSSNVWTAISSLSFFVYLAKPAIGNGLVITGRRSGSSGGGGVYSSTNAGLTWSIVGNQNYINQILFSNNVSKFFTIENSGSSTSSLTTSTDMSSRTAVLSGPLISILGINSSVVVVSNNPSSDSTVTFHRSTDNASSFSTITTSITKTSNPFVYGAVNPSGLWVVSRNAGDYACIAVSTDNGLTWALGQQILGNWVSVNVVWTGNEFVALCQKSGTSALYYSTDAIIWTTRFTWATTQYSDLHLDV